MISTIVGTFEVDQLVGIGERLARCCNSPGEHLRMIDQHLRDRDVAAGHVFLNLNAGRFRILPDLQADKDQ
jgi:hypothetical protein